MFRILYYIWWNSILTLDISCPRNLYSVEILNAKGILKKKKVEPVQK